MKKFHDQVGSIDTILLFIILVLILGIAGYLVYQHMQDTKSQSNTNSTGAAVTVATPNAFKIPELKVEMTLPSGLSDLTYTPQYYQYGDNKGRVSAYGVTSAKLLAIDKGCTATEGSIGFLQVMSAADASAMETGTNDKQVLSNGRVLVLEEPNGYCFTDPTILNNQVTLTKDGDVQTSQTALLKQALSTAKPTN